MKRLILPFLILPLFVGAAFGQEGEVTLDTFDKCNNWARHYCQSGNHEMVVNQELLKLKKAGVPITIARIKMMAQRIKPDTMAKPEGQ